jgi:hypothetical protein
MYADESEPGAIKWNLLNSYGNKLHETNGLNLAAPVEALAPFSEGGGATGRLNAGESSGFSHIFIVRAKPLDFVGASVLVAVEKGINAADRKVYKTWQQLQPIQ